MHRLDFALCSLINAPFRLQYPTALGNDVSVPRWGILCSSTDRDDFCPHRSSTSVLYLHCHNPLQDPARRWHYQETGRYRPKSAWAKMDIGVNFRLPSSADSKSPFDLANLPFDLQLAVLDQLDVFSFDVLKRTSKYMLNLCKSGGIKPKFLFDKMLYIRDRIGQTVHCYWKDHPTQEIYRALLNDDIPFSTRRVGVKELYMKIDWPDFTDDDLSFIEGKEFQAKRFYVNQNIRCSVEKFINLIEGHGIRDIIVEDNLRNTVSFPEFNRFLSHSTVKNMSNLSFQNLESVDYSIENALALRATTLGLPSITTETLLIFIKEWMAGSKEVKQFTFLDVTDGLFVDFHSYISGIRTRMMTGLDDVLIFVDYKQQRRKKLKFVNGVVLRLNVSRPPDDDLYITFKYRPATDRVSVELRV